MPKKAPAITFLVHDKETLVSGYAWRLWWHDRSFYLTPRWIPMSGLKVSFHGADDTHSTPGYLVGIDCGALPKAEAAGGVTNMGLRRLEFTGRELEPGVLHVATLRWTSGLFRKGCPSAPTPGLKPTAVGVLVPAPVVGFAADVDVSSRRASHIGVTTKNRLTGTTPGSGQHSATPTTST